MKKKIAVFTTGWCSEILSQFLTGMQHALEGEKADIFLFLCYPTHVDTHAVKKGEMNIYNLPDLHGFDGVFIFGSGLDFHDRVEDILARSREAGIPVIMQGATHEGVCYVGSDNYQATKAMCEHLCDVHGVRAITFFAGTTDSADSELRLKAVRDYLEEKGRSEDLKEVFYTRWENAAVTRHIKELCAEGRELPDAFICANDGLAMETCISLSNNGYEVPRDVLVCGYDFIDDSQVFDPSIASVDQCFTEMGSAGVKLWLDSLAGAEPGASQIISCQFMPGDSCGCSEVRNSDRMRRRKGREAFSVRAMTTYFNRKLNLIDSTILSCLTYEDFKRNLRRLLSENHDYEGDSFHILLEPNFGLSIYDPGIRLKTKGYSKQLEVIYSTEDGVPYRNDRFSTSELIPNYDCEGANHLYVFLPLHEADEAYGYIIFRDCMEKVENHFLHTYQSRMGLVFDKFRHALSLDLINKRLLDLMRRDPLTNVSNRMAYEDKEKYLQSKINSETVEPFAIAMFDVNNLKLINDSLGHDAGDDYLIRSCHLICNIFKHSPVFRVGGDEFIAVLSGGDFEEREELREDLNRHMSPYSAKLPLPSDYVSIACGISVYRPGEDMSVQDVVKRADEEMYRIKAEMKKTKQPGA
ncbi:MAG: GGDEF domain-containing protein [Lachnospiraceae bacterium]|nr:GGDEF domain-containing protein [Lachnospiraceae bacterium]